MPGSGRRSGRQARHARGDPLRARRRAPLTAGFGLEQIHTEVLIWHGEQDRNDPAAMARLQEQRLPRATARYYPGEGHLIFFSRIAEILTALTPR